MISIKRICVGVAVGIGGLYFLGRAAQPSEPALDTTQRDACAYILAATSTGRMTKADGAAQWRSQGCR